jgi:DNA-binding NtrC family response regulator
MLRMAFELDGHEVRESLDPDSTIQEYLAYQPELLCLDLDMPGGGGSAVILGLASAGVPLCPVLIVTSSHALLLPDAEAQLEMHELVEKPFQMGSLRIAAQQLLRAA